MFTIQRGTPNLLVHFSNGANGFSGLRID